MIALTPKIAVLTFAACVGDSATSTIEATTTIGAMPAWIHPRRRGLTTAATSATPSLTSSPRSDGGPDGRAGWTARPSGRGRPQGASRARTGRARITYVIVGYETVGSRRRAPRLHRTAPGGARAPGSVGASSTPPGRTSRAPAAPPVRPLRATARGHAGPRADAAARGGHPRRQPPVGAVLRRAGRDRPPSRRGQDHRAARLVGGRGRRGRHALDAVHGQ